MPAAATSALASQPWRWSRRRRESTLTGASTTSTVRGQVLHNPQRCAKTADGGSGASSGERPATARQRQRWRRHRGRQRQQQRRRRIRPAAPARQVPTVRCAAQGQPARWCRKAPASFTETTSSTAHMSRCPLNFRLAAAWCHVRRVCFGRPAPNVPQHIGRVPTTTPPVELIVSTIEVVVHGERLNSTSRRATHLRADYFATESPVAVLVNRAVVDR